MQFGGRAGDYRYYNKRSEMYFELAKWVKAGGALPDDRELKEEIGYGAREMHILGTLSLSPSYMSSMTHVVLARDLYPERLVGDEPEELEVVPWKLSELHTLLAHPEVSEGRSIAALFMAREFLAGRYRPRV